MAQKLIEQERSRFQQFVYKRGIYIAMAATFAGLFIGIPLLIWFISVTIVNIGTLFFLIFLCGALGLIQWRYIKDHMELEYHQFAMYAFSGFAMCFLNLLLFINLNVKVHEKSETYDISQFTINGARGSFEVVIDDKALARSLTTFLDENYYEIPEAKTITIVYATGLLGFDTIKECKFY